jgi:catechol 2,3-dioxygenase-like lactoylglutathione lyase family enzyme
MEPHIDVITLAVADLDRSLAFYRDGLGLETPGVTGTEFVGDEAKRCAAAGVGRWCGTRSRVPIQRRLH